MQDLHYKNSEVLALHLAQDLASRMNQTIKDKGRVSLALSGGRTPELLFQKLSLQPIDWGKVVLTLVDERWVEPSDTASNERLLRTHLLQGEALKAWLVPLKNRAASAAEGYMECENRLFAEIPQLDYAVLGMGNDGHTASWFPHSDSLVKALSEDSQAKCLPVLDAPQHQRMTLTWHALMECRHLFLHFEGEDKNATFAEACNVEQIHDELAMPVRKLLNQKQVPLSIYRTV